MPPESQPAVRAPWTPLAQALQQLARRAENSAALSRLFVYALALLPLAVAFIDYFAELASAGSEINALPLMLSVAWALFIAVPALLYSYGERRRLRLQLGRSDLFTRIALDGLEHDPIFEACPWPWRAMLPRNSGRSLLPALRRVGGNLDWYLRPTPRLWRWDWLLPLLLPACVALAWTPAGLFYLGPSQLLLVILPLLFVAYLQVRRQLWTEELVRHLHDALEGVSMDEPAGLS